MNEKTEIKATYDNKITTPTIGQQDQYRHVIFSPFFVVNNLIFFFCMSLLKPDMVMWPHECFYIRFDREIKNNKNDWNKQLFCSTEPQPWQQIKHFSTKVHWYLSNFSTKKHMLWYSLEAPRWGASNEYPQHMFSWRNKKKYLSDTSSYLEL